MSKPMRPARSATLRWSLRLPDGQRQAVQDAVLGAPPLVVQLVRRFDERTAISAPMVTSCGRGVSCAVVRVDGDGGAAYAIELGRDDLGHDAGSRFLVLHELGHLVDHAVVSSAEMAQFQAAFRRSDAWRPCFSHAGGCVPSHELFAEQFAMYAAGTPRSHTTYDVPLLIGPARFEAMLARAAREQ